MTGSHPTTVQSGSLLACSPTATPMALNRPAPTWTDSSPARRKRREKPFLATRCPVSRPCRHHEAKMLHVMGHAPPLTGITGPPARPAAHGHGAGGGRYDRCSPPARRRLKSPVPRVVRSIASSLLLYRQPRFLRPVWRSEARGKVAMRFGHPGWQVAGAEQSGFEYFLRIECQAVQSADEDGLVADLASLQTSVGRPTGHCLQRGPGSWVWRRARAVVMRPGGSAASRRWRTRWR
jgi:hypothetical protein